MAKNQISNGETLDVTLISDTESGVAIATPGKKIVVTLTAGKAGDVVACATCGAWELPKVSADVVTQGTKLYLKDGTAELTTTASGNHEAGYAFEAAAGGETSVQAVLK
ncbi:recombinase RecA [Psychromonas sp. psych-6C06]|uniref:DUF2190 family protein n=1 Tax=Psychromonas sp. psych-6C06 TaxID=2058089 RepID=UPI000C32C425|nr:DUF2190 family protein [Psychromonas sp. psych-6C06]PKF60621.1 recombinase RecA [Psychromonas sp. psych-6C06]